MHKRNKNLDLHSNYMLVIMDQPSELAGDCDQHSTDNL